MVEKEFISSEQYPRKSQLSPAVKVPGYVYTSGQIGKGADIATATLNDVLVLAGSSLDRVIKFTIFLTDMDNYADMNVVFEEVVSDPKPARTCVQVVRLPGSADGIIEIEAVALVP